MDSTKFFLPFFSLLFIFSLLSGQGLARKHRIRPSKLFVFGDSYVDTGNVGPSSPNYPKFPYGITFPGKPDGRFSNGRVLTDYVAKLVGLKPPTPFRLLGKARHRGKRYGVNFAYGGTGVFQTGFNLPNMTTQIDYFHNLIAKTTFTAPEITSSLALVSVSGNDYSYFLNTNGSIQGFKPLIIRVVNQIAVNLKRIHSFGVKKIVITALGPLGCVPEITALSSFKECNATISELVDLHNFLLREAVAILNREGTSDYEPFFILDLHDAFLSIIQNKGNPQGNATFSTPLQPCCFGTSFGYSCGSVDEKGNKKYVLCKDPNSAFYWDGVHPTQVGWSAVLSSLVSTMKQLY